MHPVRYTKWVYRLSLAGALLGLLIAGWCIWAGESELGVALFVAGPLVLGVPPMVIGLFWWRPRCPTCGKHVRFMPGKRIAWFCPPCKRIYQTDVPGDSDSSD